MKIRKFSSVVFAILLTTVGVIAQTATEPSAERLKKDVSYLASEALEGRRAGTAGADVAAQYIAKQFAQIGLRSVNKGKGYLQRFPYVAGVELGKSNLLLARMNDAQMSLKVGTDWMPLGFSANGQLDNAAAIFVGYGITASELNHNDYADPKVAGRIAIALSGTPDGDNPHGKFLRYEGVRWKAIAARNAGAKALIVIARENNFNEDRLAKLRYDNSAGDAGIPVVVISRKAATDLRLNKPLAELEEAAKSKSAAAYAEAAWSINLSVDVTRREVPAHNVIGVLEGSDPVLKKEAIVIGAHYDHLGRGGEGSGSLSPKAGEIHHGADDNASGTAGLLELARVFSAQHSKLKRTLIFIAFGAEEEGLLGSNYYVNHPVTPLANTVAMINMDMIGRMKDRKLTIGGVGSAKEWREIIREANAALTVKVNATNDSPPPVPPVGRPNAIPIVVSANGRTIMTFDPKGTFDLTMTEDGVGPSDHASFYLKQVPVLFFWTGTHSDYHKPSDTFDKINYEDEARILRLVARIIIDVDEAEKRPTYVTAKVDATPRTGGFRVYIGTMPNYADSSNGLLIDGVREDSPAAKAGIKAGDRIVKIGEREIKNVYDYTFALGEMKAGQEYVFEVMRGTEKLSVKVTPAEGRR